MKPTSQPYLPGDSSSKPMPLDRFLPPLPGGMAGRWLRERVSPGGWLIDPLGANPALPIEAARGGYRVLVASNNPVLTFMLEMLASAPRAAEIRSALIELGDTRRGDERLEMHLRSLYATECPACGQTIQAQGFLWRRDEAVPYARLIACPHCGENGEHLLGPPDLERLNRLGSGSLHRSRAIERVTLDPEDRPAVEEALRSYQPRPLYVLFTLINRVEGLPTSLARKRLLTALLLDLLDEGSSLWAYPSGRARPRQLTIPPVFKENNLWLALDEATLTWGDDRPPVPLTYWPALPPETGGICLYPGRLRSLLPLTEAAGGEKILLAAALAVLPRPNQAFWLLSALWAGWIWGREAVQPLKSAFERQRYDWHWHAAALHSVFSSLNANLTPGFPFFALLPELVPGFLTATLAASQAAGLELESLALREEGDPAQALWKGSRARSPQLPRPAESIFREGIQTHLLERGEPAEHLSLFAAGLLHFTRLGGLPLHQAQVSDQAIDSVQPAMNKVFSDRAFLVHYRGGSQSAESGLWWLAHPENAAAPLAERVETAVAALLRKGEPRPENEIEAATCAALPGLDAPPAGLVRACLESYGEPAEGQPEAWRLRPDQSSAALAGSLQQALDTLHLLAPRLGFRPEDGTPFQWLTSQGQPAYAFWLAAAAQISATLLDPRRCDHQCVLVYPGSREELLRVRLQHDPRLSEAAVSGWRFLKIEPLLEFAAAPGAPQRLVPDWEALLNSEPPHWREATQMQMF